MTETEDLGNVTDVRLSDAISDRYLTYALSTIVSRSLPDARDGLKPVHRRLLYAMRQLKLDPQSGFKKCARVVGDVIGKFHPHGDVAVYDTLVRLAQEFALRYPLVQGHGNFGNIDGDSAAAMRYTEARMTAVAEALMEGIDEDTVEFRSTYDGEDSEPVVLPGAFPNLLANGASGIAVGMATNIPPHHVGELVIALKHLIHDPQATTETLMQVVPGPDFPTGGIIAEDPAVLREAYESGRGSLRLRARWSVEPGSRGTQQIVISEIPYQVPKGRLIEQLASFATDKKIPFRLDIRDESTEAVRIVILVKDRQADPRQLMELLYKQTDLETRVSLNMNVLTDGRTPKLVGLKDLLRIFLDHRFVVLRRQTQFRLRRTEERLEIVTGLLIALADIDTVIRIIREEDEPKTALMLHFSITDRQAEAILNMRLRQLRKLNEIELRSEDKQLRARKAELEGLLADDGLCWAAIETDLDGISKRFGADSPFGGRRTEIGPAPSLAKGLVAVAVTAKEPITILYSKRGWLRAVRGQGTDPGDIRYKEGDEGLFQIDALTTDRLVFFCSNGKSYTVNCDRLSLARGFGEPLRLMIDLEDTHEPIAMFVHEPDSRLLVASEGGLGFVVEAANVIGQTRNGKLVMTLQDHERAVRCLRIQESHDSVAIVSTDRKLLVFPLAELPQLARGKGVILQRCRGSQMADIRTFSGSEGLSWRSGRGIRTETDLDQWRGRRGQAGRPVPRGFPADTQFA